MAKVLDLSQLSIKNMIVHDIPKHKMGDLAEEPLYSKTESTLTDGLRMFFKQKVTEALQSDRAIKVVYDDESDSPVAYITNSQFTEKSPDFISNSKEIAKHLFTIQKGQNSGGIIVLMNCLLEKTKIIVILKLERDNGVQLKINDATKSIDIEEVKNLMLTQRTKIFKVALLLDESTSGVDYVGVVMDYQIDMKIKNEVTSFFIKAFLGCKPHKEPKTTTKEFYRLTKFFIGTIDDEIKKSKYLQDLNSYLQMNTQRLSGREFADNYLTTTVHKNNYKDFLSSKNFKFDSFIKDTSLISNKIERISIEFVNGVTILGKSGTLKDKVKLTELDNGKHKAEIISKIKRVE